MEIMTCKEYNRLQLIKYKKAVDKWKQMKNPGLYPFKGLYIIDKEYGYVLRTKNRALWRKTKKELIEIWVKEK
jgi:hypothetical protein